MKNSPWWCGSSCKRILQKVVSVGYNLRRMYLGVEYDYTWRGLIMYVGPFWFSFRSVDPRQ